MFFTFGYSGVGKTFTLLGNDEIPGLLGSIVNSIQGINRMEVRIYEMYGLGFFEKDNWKNKIYNKYIFHKIKQSDDDFFLNIDKITETEMKDSQEQEQSKDNPTKPLILNN